MVNSSLVSLKGWDNPAQGSALGLVRLVSLKGWDNPAQGAALGLRREKETQP